MDHGGGRKRKYPDSDAIEIIPEASSGGYGSNALSLRAIVDDEASRPREAHQIPIVTSSASSALAGEGARRRPCRNFHSEEGCSRGGSCKFLHDEQSRSRESVAVSISPAVEGGRYGSGASGSIPRPLNWKTKRCIHWERRGDCHLGSRCKYVHGTAELQHGERCMQGGSRDSMQAGTPRAHTDPIASSTTSGPHDKGVPTPGTTVAPQRQLRWFHPRQNDLAFMSRIYADWPFDLPPRNPNPNPNK